MLLWAFSWIGEDWVCGGRKAEGGRRGVLRWRIIGDAWRVCRELSNAEGEDV